MAMLAEKRQRKSYNLLSRGKALYENDSSFGVKMLEKMGWSKGKGLGANEDGNLDFVRVRYKNDAQGFGYEDRDDQWINHDVDFNSLLINLNSNSQDGTDDVIANNGTDFEQNEKEKFKGNFSGESLEEKSKNSRVRVHYKKFTRGKDLSRYSEKDLANIFGKKFTDNQTIDSEITAEKKTFKQKSKKHEVVEKTAKNINRLKTLSAECAEVVQTKESTFNEQENLNIKDNEDTINDNSMENKMENEHPHGVDSIHKNVTKSDYTKTLDENNLPFDSYAISSFCAEKFRKTDACKFVGSNLTNIIGYSFDKNLTLEIIHIENDEERINNLWSCTSNKYLNDLPSDRFKKYVKDVRVAYKAKQKLPKFNVKTWKRRKAFQNI